MQQLPRAQETNANELFDYPVSSILGWEHGHDILTVDMITVFQLPQCHDCPECGWRQKEGRVLTRFHAHERVYPIARDKHFDEHPES
jgi:hypothetical protein